MTWNFDLSSAPRGRTEQRTRTVKDKVQDYEITIEEPVWLATKGGEVLKSHFLSPTNQCPQGRWVNLATTEQPLAWMHYVKPVHPNEVQA